MSCDDHDGAGKPHTARRLVGTENSTRVDQTKNFANFGGNNTAACRLYRWHQIEPEPEAHDLPSGMETDFQSQHYSK